MAPTKKNVTVNKEEAPQAAKATVKKMPAKAEQVKAETPKVEEVKAEASKAVKPAAEKKPAAKTTEKKTAAKTTEKKTAAKATEKKTPAKAAEKKPAAKTAEKKSTAKKELKTEISVQFDGKSYSQEDLIQIAKDVWKYDLNQKASDLNSLELYVKPEEHVAYYVMNKDVEGSFYL